MSTLAECLEVAQVDAKLSELANSVVPYINEHPGFATVCLDVYVLRVANFEYWQHYGIDTQVQQMSELCYVSVNYAITCTFTILLIYVIGSW